MLRYRFESRRELKTRLNDIQAGGIFFTTLQKFGLEEGEQEYPQLSDRSNIIVMVDEAHRSHYETLDGYAHNLNTALPNAKYIAFTGTPVDKEKRSTRAIFGDYIHTYSFDRAVEEGATVPVLYQLRHVKMDTAEGIEGISQSYDELTDLMEAEIAAKTTLEQTTIMKLMASDDRLSEVAKNIVEHWEERRDLMREEMNGHTGKAMVVTSGREHAVRLFHKIVELRPEWAPEDRAQDLRPAACRCSSLVPPATLRNSLPSAAAGPIPAKWSVASKTPTIRWKSLLWPTACSPASTHPYCTPCTWIACRRNTTSCRPLPALTGPTRISSPV